MNKLRPWALAVPLCLGVVAQAQTHSADTSHRATTSGPAKRATPNQRHDRSMQPRVGKASIYADKFANRKMADGKPMNPNGDNAASKTLPLGTRALVTNLQTGKSAEVTIEDRGPYVDGRIIDLSPATADKIGLERRQGLAPVEVRPLELPPAARVASAGASDETAR